MMGCGGVQGVLFWVVDPYVFSGYVEPGCDDPHQPSGRRLETADGWLVAPQASAHCGPHSPARGGPGFFFVGAGGGAWALLQHSGIPEIRGFGGFPISGKFLRTSNSKLVAAHRAKVYGKAAV